MKSWLAKLKSSVTRQTAGSLPFPERTAWVNLSSRELEEALRTCHPRIVPPTSLHATIMESLEPAPPRNSPAPEFRADFGFWHCFRTVRSAFAFALRCGLVASVPLIMVLAIRMVKNTGSQNASPAQSLYPAIVALEAGEQMTREMPPMAFAPLAEELERLGEDLDGAKQLLAASVP